MENTQIQYPIYIKSSLKSLYGKFFSSALLALVLIVASIFTLISLDSSAQPMILGSLLGIHLVVFAYRLCIAYLRIKNTTYTIDSGVIKESSYVFKWMGVSMQSANISQLRQISAFSNSRVDVWFFKCGFVKLTVSGDMSDFKLENILRPGSTKTLIEDICFPKDR